jgi:hypothetical protein
VHFGVLNYSDSLKSVPSCAAMYDCQYMRGIDGGAVMRIEILTEVFRKLLLAVSLASISSSSSFLTRLIGAIFDLEDSEVRGGAHGNID